MDQERFDSVSRLLARGGTRRNLLGAAAALAGLSVVEAEAKRRGKPRRKRRGVGDEAAINSCARLCAFLPPRARRRCLAAAAENRVLCECPSFCIRLFADDPTAQAACLREAITTPATSLCLACGADPDLAVPIAAGGFSCAVAAA